MAYVVFFVLGVNIIALHFYWYTSLWWFDMPMHFLGGFFIGLFGFYFLPDKFLKVFLFVFLVGIGWEVFEVLVDKNISHNPFNLLDTLSDVFFDLSGGLSAIMYLWRKT